ncbi:hypothetical protein [Acinetobacter modestus]|uniref:hypothetical protein n=1 Tax=Acinetobacter modestus TaxID=1776740 RepID=UPI0030177FA8
MKLNEKVGLLAFYTIVVVAIVALSFGMLTLDKVLIGIALSLFICALLVKSEFKIEAAFWKNY